MHQTLANATFQVIAGGSRGSGFSFISEDIVITNFHVVKGIVAFVNGKVSGVLQLRCEDDVILLADIIVVDERNDFAVLKLKTKLPENRVVLQPLDSFKPARGKKLVFAGYPHGIPHLLAHEAILSAPLENHKFYLDGMVNGGNSGGPIIDADSGLVVGIITARRYVNGEKAKALEAEVAELRGQLSSASKNISVAIMGVDFGQMADMFGRSLQVITELMDLNANSGIGVGYPIFPVIEAVKQQQRTFITKF